MSTTTDTEKDSLQILNWTEAMNQVGGDRGFLDEVLADLLTETLENQESIRAGIKNVDFDKVMKAAHKIKGSTSYLCCERMNRTAMKLESVASSALTSPNEGSWENVNQLFTQFNQHFEDLKSEMKKNSDTSS